MKIDNIEVPFVNEDECQNFKETLSKYGKTVVCDEEDEKLDADIVLPGGEGCETTKEIAQSLSALSDFFSSFSFQGFDIALLHKPSRPNATSCRCRCCGHRCTGDNRRVPKCPD